MTDKFLGQIADYFTTSGRIDSLSEYTFIFPNKRSALFLKRYIQERAHGKNVLMPRFSTFRRFATRMTGVSEPQRFEALFILYNSYLEAIAQLTPERESPVQDFDKFIFWGDMIMNDFDTIDMSLADAEKLYSNLKALHDISADYLTEEQKEIIENIWGVNNLSAHIDRFWKHMGKDGDKDCVRNKFLTLWDLLYLIYNIFSRRLSEQGYATGGMLMRKTLQLIKDQNIPPSMRGKFVFVGLSELSTAELAIIEQLNKQGRAMFFWDMEGPLFQTMTAGDRGANRAVKLINTLKKKYPMPADFHIVEVDSVPEIEIIGIPSAVGQAKGAAAVVGKWLKQGEITKANAIGTAVIVPDPSLLMPLMLGLPSDIPGLNVTMGLPYSSTTFATLFGSVISMQRRARRRRDGAVAYFYQDVLEVLIHPHMRLLAGAAGDELRLRIFEAHMFNIDAAEIINALPNLSYIFTPLSDTDDLKQTHDYVTSLLSGLEEGLREIGAKGETFEIEILRLFREETSHLKDLIAKYHITMQESTFLSLFESIFNAKVLNVEGTPLEGVQVMGVLETRSLDFDNIIYMSMNERSFPRRDYVRTMIPNNLRRGYGLPPIELSEHFYAYNFLRSLSRAQRAVLFYDTRPPRSGQGEISRYLTKLKYFYGDSVCEHQVDFRSLENSHVSIEIEKDEHVRQQLESFLQKNGRNLSASALKTYKHCGLAFYLKNVNGIADDDEPIEYINAATQGDIFHKSAKRLYDKYRGRFFNAPLLLEMSRDEELTKIVSSEVAHVLGIDKEDIQDEDLSFEGIIIRNETAVQLRSMLIAESEQYCRKDDGFTYRFGEFDVTPAEYGQWEVAPGLKVNFRMQIDRIDEIDGETLRFVDYKSGHDESSADTIDILFGDNYKKDAIFQLLTYAEAYHDLVDSSKKIMPAIHVLRDIVHNGKIKPISINRNQVEPFPALSNEFRPKLSGMIKEIFDPSVPFRQNEDDSKCGYCQFAGICGRIKPEK